MPISTAPLQLMPGATRTNAADVVCPWCSSPDKVFILSSFDRLTDRTGLYRVVACGCCGLQYLENPPSDLAESYTHGYYTCRPTSTPPAIANQRIQIKRRLQRLILAYHYGYGQIRRGVWGKCLELLTWPLRHRAARRYGPGPLPKHVPYGRALDVGCGNGNWLAWMHELGTWELIGIEPHPQASAQARQAGLRVLTGTLESCPFDSAYFDVVRIWHVLEHVPNLRETLLEINRILKPGGLLIVGVPNAGGILAQAFGPHWFAYDLPRHLIHFTQDSLLKVMRESGLETRQLRTMVYGPNTIRWSLSYLLDRSFKPLDERADPFAYWMWHIMSAPIYWGLDILGRGEYLELQAIKPWK